MFNNIGKKIMGLAKFITWMGFAASIIGGIAMIIDDEDLILPAILVIVAGCLASWIACFLLYGFGQLIHNSEECKNLLKQINEKPAAAPASAVTPVGNGDSGNGGFGSFEELEGKIKF